MADGEQQHDRTELTDDELRELDAEPLPHREAMSTIDVAPARLPPLDDVDPIDLTRW